MNPIVHADRGDDAGFVGEPALGVAGGIDDVGVGFEHAGGVHFAERGSVELLLEEPAAVTAREVVDVSARRVPELLVEAGARELESAEPDPDQPRSRATEVASLI